MMKSLSVLLAFVLLTVSNEAVPEIDKDNKVTGGAVTSALSEELVQWLTKYDLHDVEEILQTHQLTSTEIVLHLTSDQLGRMQIKEGHIIRFKKMQEAIKNHEKSAAEIIWAWFHWIVGFILSNKLISITTITTMITGFAAKYYSVLCKKRQTFEWSSRYKGSSIILSENGTHARATMNIGDCVRTKHPIKRGSITEWELEMYAWNNFNFAGVTCISGRTHYFNRLNEDGKGQDLYGVDNPWENHGYLGNGRVQLNWEKPRCTTQKPFKFQVIADWTRSQCKLYFVYNNERLNGTITLPNIGEYDDWYPCVSINLNGSWCKIKSV